MKRFLVAYATMAGSTADVAQTVAEEIAKQDVQVDLLPLSEVKDLAAYDGVVVGGPMILGWHRAALRFLKQYRAAWQRIPLAVFVLALSLTQTGETSVDGVPVDVDETLPKPPTTPGRLRFQECYARLAHYVRPILRATHPVIPVRIEVFAGRLEYGRLPWWGVLFAMLILQAPAGDRRNWPAIRAWAAGLPAALQLEAEKAAAHEAVIGARDKRAGATRQV
jgi:menaquinone-dependent protoporphyrinogen oxidase